MTFKKINKTAQSVFEYFLLTTVLMVLLLMFASTSSFSCVKFGAQLGFSSATERILK